MTDGLEIYTDRKIYSIPNGLNELMYDISKEVLRSQPKNIYNFISQYLISLLKLREAVKVAVPIIERDFETADSTTNLLNKFGLTKEQGDRYASIIQAAYRGYRTRKRLMNLVEEFRNADGTSRHKDIDRMSEEIDYNDPLFQSLQTRGATMEQRIAAATKIQAYFRGYAVRKMDDSRGKECLIRDIPSHESWRHDWLKDPLPEKQNTVDEYPWRKSFTDFHKNYLGRHEGDRLHIETIFKGNYEDYKLICDYTSCQELNVPTRLEAKEMARPGDIESSTSEELSISSMDVEEVKKLLMEEGEKVVTPPLDEFMLLLDKVPEKISSSSKLGESSMASITEDEKEQKSELGSVRGSVSSQPSLIGSIKSKGSIRSSLTKSKGSISSKVPPELSVKSLSIAGEEGEGVVETGSAKSSKGSKRSKEGSVTSHGSKGSKQLSIQEGSKKSVQTVEEEISRRDSKKSNEARGSKASVSSETKKKDSLTSKRSETSRKSTASRKSAGGDSQGEGSRKNHGESNP